MTEGAKDLMHEQAELHPYMIQATDQNGAIMPMHYHVGDNSNEIIKAARTYVTTGKLAKAVVIDRTTNKRVAGWERTIITLGPEA